MDALDRFALRIDRINDPGEAAGDQVAEHGVTDPSALVARTNHGDALRIEDLVEVADAHGKFYPSD